MAIRAIPRRLPFKAKSAGASATAVRRSYSTVETSKPLTSILIANRGEIALRVGKTANEYGVRTTTLYTDPDAMSQHALSSPFNVNLGASSAYLDGDRIIQVAKEQGCDSVHPGYGFLSENSAFARKCADAGLIFIGPPPEAIEAMGNKSRSKEIMNAAGVPCIPGYHGSNQDTAFLQDEAEKIGFPVLLKAVKGGGGKGMRICQSASDFQDQLKSAKSEAMNSFGDDVMLVEKYIQVPRHIEVQVFADKHGTCLALGERDCSVQRRHQKILEESPAPGLHGSIRKDLWEKARAAALAVNYVGAGTVEFIFDNETGEFFFMEMNTRLQVEHPVTEMVTDTDLVDWQIRAAQGEPLPTTQEDMERTISERGHAIEARIYAENPDLNFIPDSGTLLHLSTPPATPFLRIDTSVTALDTISPHYDPMIAKLIVHGRDRPTALRKLHSALQSYEIAGPTTNIEFLKRLCLSQDFADGKVETGYIEKHRDELFGPSTITPVVWAQAALGTLLQETASANASNALLPTASPLGFGPTTSYQRRTFHLARSLPPGSDQDSQPTTVTIQQTAATIFDITIGDTVYTGVQAVLTSDRKIQSFFPHTRLDGTLIRHPSPSSSTTFSDDITLFTLGSLFRLTHTVPAYLPLALGHSTTSLSSSSKSTVVAPMPSKILRIDVSLGDAVVKDQSLVVVESMKMEMVIRAPVAGVVGKIVGGVGDVVGRGGVLVEFVSPEEGEAKGQ